MNGALVAGTPHAAWIAAAVALAAVGSIALGPRRPLRVAAIVAALTALAVIGLRPERRSAPSRGDIAILVTSGADPAQVRSLRASLGGAHLLAIGDPEVRAEAGIEIVPDAGAIVRRHPGLATLHVVGWGLNEFEWAELPGIGIEHHPAPPPPGITHLSWFRDVRLGSRLVVQGTLAGRPASGSWVFLEAPSGIVDSVPVDTVGGRFALSATPRAAGRHRYVVRVGTPSARTETPFAAETLGVSVVERGPPRLLVLESAPSFETGALKRWLAEAGGVLAIRSTVSRDRSRSEFLNRDAADLRRITTTLLDEFDVVLIDGRALAALAADERAVLRRSVRERGLGVLVRSDDAVLGPSTLRPADRSFFIGATPRVLEGLDRRDVRVVWRERAGPTATAVEAEPYELPATFGGETVLRDAAGRSLAQVWPRGAGRTALVLVSAPSRWAREGDHATFAGYWSSLLSAVTSRDADGDHWTVDPAGLVAVGRPVALALHTARPAPVGTIVDEAGARDTVYLTQDPVEPTRWRGTFWPRTAGWHRLDGGAGAAALLVRENGGGLSRQASARLAATTRQLVRRAAGPDEGTPPAFPAPPVGTPIGLLPWFLVFLTATGYLWGSGPRRPN